MSVDVGSAVGYLDLDISGFLSGLRDAQDEANRQTKNTAITMGNNISSVGKGLSSAGSSLTRNLTVPLMGVGAVGLKVATDFEKGMSNVKAVSGATGKDFDALREKAIELGSDTAFSANEVAEAMAEMAKAGWNSQQIIDGMGGVLDATAASGENLGTVATIVADTITGFGMAAKDSTRIADLLTQAANDGTIGITDLGESFKYVAPAAKTMGFSVEDVTTAISAMSKAGIKGSQAGTSLRGVLSRMVGDNKKVKETMEELGIVITNSDGSFKSLNEIVSIMRDSFEGLTDEEKTYYATTIAGQEGQAGLLALLNLTEEEYNAIADSMNNASGVAQKTADTMQDNLQSKVEQLGGALESLAIKLADYLIPHLQKFIVWLTNLVDKFMSLGEGTQKTILVIAGLIAALGPVLSIVGKITTVVGGAVTAFGKLSSGFAAVSAGGTAGAGVLTKLGGAIAGLSGPVLAVVAVIGVLIAAFVSLWKSNEEFRNKVIAIWNQIKESFSGFFNGIVEILNSLGFEFKSFSEVLSALWKGLCDLLGPLFIGAFQFIADTLGGILNIILGVLKVFIGFFTGDWNMMLEGIKQIFKAAWDWIANTLRNVGNTLKGILDVILGWFNSSFEKCFNGIKTFFVNVWTGISTWFKNTLTDISKFFSNVWNGIKSTLTNIVNSIKTTIENVFNSIKTTITNIWNDVKSTISSVVSSIKSTISDGFNSAKDTVTNIFSSIKSSISNAMESAKNIVSNAIDKIKGFFKFDWSLPKLKLPHFSMSGEFSLFPPSVPKISVDWYDKAMKNGIILNGATIFGMDKFGNLMGGGETGSETVVGTNSLMKMIEGTVRENIAPIIDVMRDIAKATAELGYVTYNGFVKAKQAYNDKDGGDRPGNGKSGGDTFIFNSPKAIDEVEAARQMRKAKRELAEGF